MTCPGVPFDIVIEERLPELNKNVLVVEDPFVSKIITCILDDRKVIRDFRDLLSITVLTLLEHLPIRGSGEI